jgi:hypothetical protein
MNIFGITFTTKKEQSEAQAKLAKLNNQISELKDVVIAHENELVFLRSVFPFNLGQRVYDISLKDAKGKFTKTKPSLKYSTINEIFVDAHSKYMTNWIVFRK